MSFLSLLFIASSLAMDAFAVSISAGLSSKKIFFRQAILLACTFGIFQAVMPLFGWFGGNSLRNLIEPIDHWVIFIILGFIGGNMIRESFSQDEEEKRDYFTFSSLMALGIATSIDALAVGISFSLLSVNILIAVLLIGIVTFLFCFTGVYFGKKFGHLLEKKAELFGGVVLLCIGTKILVEHLFL